MAALGLACSVCISRAVPRPASCFLLLLPLLLPASCLFPIPTSSSRSTHPYRARVLFSLRSFNFSKGLTPTRRQSETHHWIVIQPGRRQKERHGAQSRPGGGAESQHQPVTMSCACSYETWTGGILPHPLSCPSTKSTFPVFIQPYRSQFHAPMIKDAARTRDGRQGKDEET